VPARRLYTGDKGGRGSISSNRECRLSIFHRSINNGWKRELKGSGHVTCNRWLAWLLISVRRSTFTPWLATRSLPSPSTHEHKSLPRLQGHRVNVLPNFVRSDDINPFVPQVTLLSHQTVIGFRLVSSRSVHFNLEFFDGASAHSHSPSRWSRVSQNRSLYRRICRRRLGHFGCSRLADGQIPEATSQNKRRRRPWCLFPQRPWPR